MFFWSIKTPVPSARISLVWLAKRLRTARTQQTFRSIHLSLLVLHERVRYLFIYFELLFVWVRLFLRNRTSPAIASLLVTNPNPNEPTREVFTLRWGMQSKYYKKSRASDVYLSSRFFLLEPIYIERGQYSHLQEFPYLTTDFPISSNRLYCQGLNASTL